MGPYHSAMTEHVLIPIDGSEMSFDAFEFAIDHHPEAKLTVIHVVSPTEGLVGSGDAMAVNQQAIDSAVKRGEEFGERARDILQEADSLEGRSFETAVQIGRPAATIVEYAEDNDVDHIVMGSHGRSGLTRVLMGSVAETVVRRAPVPVTVVR